MINLIIYRINELVELLSKQSKHTYDYRQVKSLLDINNAIYEAIKDARK